MAAVIAFRNFQLNTKNSNDLQCIKVNINIRFDHDLFWVKHEHGLKLASVYRPSLKINIGNLYILQLKFYIYTHIYILDNEVIDYVSY